MILRNRRISRDANEVSLQISYSLPDVRKQLREYYDKIGGMAFQEAEAIFYLSHTLFNSYEEKHADELSKWALRLSLRNGLIIESVNSPNTYYLSDLLGGRGPGRPAKDCV